MSKKPKDATVTLACTECGQRNYTTDKSHAAQGTRMEIRKFCPKCKSHQLHKETP